MIERITLEGAEDRTAPATKVVVLSNVANVIYVSIEVQEDTDKVWTTRPIQDKEATEGEGALARPMKAELAVDAGDFEDAVKLLRRRERRFEERLKTEKVDEDRRKIERPWRDLEAAVEKANYRAETLHTKYQEEIAKSEELAREVAELQEALKARRAAVEGELPQEAAAEHKAAIKAESEASS